MLTAPSAFSSGRKLALYCSDVAGAFDRVDRKRLITKLEAAGFHPSLVKVLSSWLEYRMAKVIVGGEQSEEMTLLNMVFQRTVLGPILWNLFYDEMMR